MTAALGKLLLLLGCTALGLGRGFGLKRRTACLFELRRALETMGRELTFSLRPLGSLMDQARRESRGEACALFAACQEKFAHTGGESWAESWRTALETTSLPLKEEDRRILSEAGQILGRYDGEDQRRALGGLLARLEEQAQEARSEEKRLFRVYTALGITAGLFCVILL